MSFISCITQFITQAEIFQVKCKCSPLLEAACSALNNLHSDKFLCNIEKSKIFFSDNEIVLLYYRTVKTLSFR